MRDAHARQHVRAIWSRRLCGHRRPAGFMCARPCGGGTGRALCSNMAEALVSKGLAGVVRYRLDDDNRASAYDQLLAADER